MGNLKKLVNKVKGKKPEEPKAKEAPKPDQKPKTKTKKPVMLGADVKKSPINKKLKARDKKAKAERTKLTKMLAKRGSVPGDPH